MLNIYYNPKKSFPYVMRNDYGQVKGDNPWWSADYCREFDDRTIKAIRSMSLRHSTFRNYGYLRMVNEEFIKMTLFFASEGIPFNLKEVV